MKKFTYLIFLILILLGCGTPSNYYRLYPTIPSKEGSFNLSKKVIGVAEVKLADYIDKPQIVTKASLTSVKIHEKENWAGDFAKNIQLVLTQNLNALVKRYTFVALPSEEAISDRYRIFVTIYRFDSTAEAVKLQGKWSLLNLDSNKIVKVRGFNYSLWLEDNSTKAVTQTESLLLEKLSKDIAFFIKKI